MVTMYRIICCSDTSKYESIRLRPELNNHVGRTALIKERSLILRLNGLLLNENPGSSNIKKGENPFGLKSKVSHSMTIIVGLVISKSRPNWSNTKNKLVNIPVL